MGTTNILGQRRYRLRQQRRRAALALGLGERKTIDGDPKATPGKIASKPS